MRTAWFLLLPQTHILDLAGPLQALGSCAELDLAPVEVRCTAPQPEIHSFQGVTLTGLEPLPERLDEDDVLFVVGNKMMLSDQERKALDSAATWLERTMAKSGGLDLCSICTGAFLLGRAGLLDGRDCTTHHRYVPLLQELYPQARVLSNRLFVEDGPLCTTAGVSAGADLALHVIGRRLGREVASQVAQELVIYRRRAGEDPQLGIQELTRNHIHPLVHAVQDYLEENASAALNFEHLAIRFNVSYRHLARLFRENTGLTLQTFLRRQRIERARRLLRESRMNVEQVAERCGFGSAHAFRVAWNKEVAETPLQFRKAALNR